MVELRNSKLVKPPASSTTPSRTSSNSIRAILTCYQPHDHTYLINQLLPFRPWIPMLSLAGFDRSKKASSLVKTGNEFNRLNSTAPYTSSLGWETLAQHTPNDRVGWGMQWIQWDLMGWGGAHPIDAGIAWGPLIWLLTPSDSLSVVCWFLCCTAIFAVRLPLCCGFVYAVANGTAICRPCGTPSTMWPPVLGGLPAMGTLSYDRATGTAVCWPCYSPLLHCGHLCCTGTAVCRPCDTTFTT
jgi:hypothetical protein